MTQDYPQGQTPGQYGHGQAPNPYQQPQAPYGQAPYGQAPPQYGANPYDQPQAAHPPQPQAPYGGQQPYGGQAPYGHQQPQAPYGQAPAQYPPRQPGPGFAPQPGSIPPEAGGFRLGIGAILDFAAAAVAGCAVGIGLVHKVPGIWWLLGIVAAVLFSFANQVLLTRLAGCSVGKFLVATRVMRPSDAGRPHTVRLAQRWLIAGVLGWVTTLVFNEAIPTPDDFNGVRIVRWKHLRERLG